MPLLPFLKLFCLATSFDRDPDLFRYAIGRPKPTRYESPVGSPSTPQRFSAWRSTANHFTTTPLLRRIVIEVALDENDGGALVAGA